MRGAGWGEGRVAFSFLKLILDLALLFREATNCVACLQPLWYAFDFSVSTVQYLVSSSPRQSLV